MPRRKLTKPKDLDDLRDVADGLPDLTDKQQQFLEGILAGKSASAAYRAAYDCERSSDHVIRNEASRLLANPDIALTLSAARKACFGSAVLTKDAHVQQLERLREVALDTGNVGAAVQAEHYRGKVGGYYVERYEDVTPPNPLPLLERLAAVCGPDLGNMLAEGIASRLRLAHDVTPDKVSSEVTAEN